MWIVHFRIEMINIHFRDPLMYIFIYYLYQNTMTGIRGRPNDARDIE